MADQDTSPVSTTRKPQHRWPQDRDAAFDRGHEAALAPQSEQVWVGLSLTPQTVTAFCNGPLPVTTAWP